MLIKILFECTRFFKLQNVVKIDAISIQIRRVLLCVGLIPGCICLYTAGPLSPPRLVYRDRPITGEAYKNVCVCVCVGVGGGGGGGGGGGAGVAYKRKFMVFALKR